MHTHKDTRSVQTALTTDPLDAYNSVLRLSLLAFSHADASLLQGLHRNRNYEKLIAWADSQTPQLYESSAEYFAANQIALLIRKYPFPADVCPGLNPEASAIRKFKAAENRCKRVNTILPLRRFCRIDDRMSIIEHAKEYVIRVIGETPDYEAIYDKCSVTTGAAIGTHGNTTNQARKILSKSWSVSSSALPYAIAALWHNSHARDAILPGRVKCYDRDMFNHLCCERAAIANYNKIAFVPKTAKTHRAIAVEPFLNGYVQKGIDEFFRLKLRNRGIDLRDQSKNQALARLGSRGGHNPYVTLDLSSASDTIASEFVREMLPYDWWRLLDATRSRNYLLDGEILPYHKFCSMGNGFCFPLQSLLFAALIYGSRKWMGVDNPYDFNVYGDDLVTRQDTALLLKEVLQRSGFQLNTEKSFIVGPFRESCGADWWQGQDVRPVTFDKPLNDIRVVMSLHNSFYRSARTETFGVNAIMPYLRGLSTRPFLRPGREEGDTCFSVPLDVAVDSPYVKWDSDSQHWTWKEIESRTVSDTDKALFRAYPWLDVVVLNHTKWMAVIGGASSEQPFTLRYATKARIVSVGRPYWDAYTASRSLPWQRLDRWILRSGPLESWAPLRAPA